MHLNGSVNFLITDYSSCWLHCLDGSIRRNVGIIDMCSCHIILCFALVPESLEFNILIKF
jgi:hypothetical protein